MTTTRGRTEWQKQVDAILKGLDKRMTEFETQNAVYRALQDEQRKQLDDRFARVQDNITNTNKELSAKVDSVKASLTADFSTIKSAINKVLTAVLIAIMIAFVNYALQGGLKIPT